VDDDILVVKLPQFKRRIDIDPLATIRRGATVDAAGGCAPVIVERNLHLHPDMFELQLIDIERHALNALIFQDGFG